MKKILINFAHPAKRKSTVNRGLLDAVSSLPNVTVNDLYQHYPDFLIDVEREQTLCETHDIIIFQHPLYWYSTPAIVKEWMDLVLEHGWAYGSQGNALKDKVTFQTISAGGDASTYQASGANGFTINQLTSPFAATAHLCQMRQLPPFFISGVHRGLPKETLATYADRYRQLLTALTYEQVNIDRAVTLDNLNEHIVELTEAK